MLRYKNCITSIYNVTTVACELIRGISNNERLAIVPRFNR